MSILYVFFCHGATWLNHVHLRNLQDCYSMIYSQTLLTFCYLFPCPIFHSLLLTNITCCNWKYQRILPHATAPTKSSLYVYSHITWENTLGVSNAQYAYHLMFRTTFTMVTKCLWIPSLSYFNFLFHSTICTLNSKISLRAFKQRAFYYAKRMFWGFGFPLSDFCVLLLFSHWHIDLPMVRSESEPKC